MKKILNYLNCEDIQEVIKKMKSSQITDELRELRELIYQLTRNEIIYKDVIKNKKQLLEFLKLSSLNSREEFKVICLNSENEVVGEKTLFQGTLDKIAIYPREIAEEILKYPTKAVIFAQNKGGKLRPNKQDIQIVEHMQDFLQKIEIEVLDHILVNNTNYFSFSEEGLI